MYSDIATNWLKKLEEIYAEHKQHFEESQQLIFLVSECFLSLNLVLPSYKWWLYVLTRLFYYSRIKPYERSYYSAMMLQGGHVWRIDSTVKITKNTFQYVKDENGHNKLGKINFTSNKQIFSES